MNWLAPASESACFLIAAAVQVCRLRSAAQRSVPPFLRTRRVASLNLLAAFVHVTVSALPLFGFDASALDVIAHSIIGVAFLSSWAILRFQPKPALGAWALILRVHWTAFALASALSFAFIIAADYNTLDLGLATATTLLGVWICVAARDRPAPSAHYRPVSAHAQPDIELESKSLVESSQRSDDAGHDIVLDEEDIEESEACAKWMASQRNPEEQASACSRFLFRYLNSFLLIARRETVELKHVPPICSQDRVSSASEQFRREWLAEYGQKQGNASLIGCLWRAHRRQIIGNWVWLFPALLARLSSPYLLNALLSFLGDESSPVWVGVVLSVALLLSPLIETACWSRFGFNYDRLSTQARAALTDTIYRKALRMSLKLSPGEAGHAAFESGSSAASADIVNLISVDADRVCKVLNISHWLIEVPVVFSVAVYSLFRLLGVVPVLAGLAVALLLTPFNGLFARCGARVHRAFMHHKDGRMRLMDEMLQGIRVVKLFAWENFFRKRIDEVRLLEMLQVRKKGMVTGASRFWADAVPSFVTTAIFAVFALRGEAMDPATVFTASALLQLLQQPITRLPAVLAVVIEGRISARRIVRVLHSLEAEPDVVTRGDRADNAPAVRVEQGTFSWSAQSHPAEQSTLRDINVTVPTGALVCIVGPVGSGKSSLLSALLGEMHRVSGAVHVCGRIAYCAQSPWIRNASLRDNVVFNAPFDQTRYDRALRVCSLLPDLAALPARDLTEIGEKGIGLSGGQKARVALARAVFADADVVLLDDPLSAVDAHVGSALFNDCIAGELRGKTRLLVTHQLQFVNRADLVLVMREGRLVHAGKFDDLLAAGALDVAEFKHLHAESKSEASAPAAAPTGKAASSAQTASITAAEERLVGTVPWAVARQYFSMLGWWTLAVCAMLLVQQGTSVLTSWWLSQWTDDADYSSHPLHSYLLLYLLFTASAAAAAFGFQFSVVWASFRASLRMHGAALSGVLNASFAFFDSTPLGRILNRFAKDCDVVDDDLAFTISVLLRAAAVVVSVVVVISLATPAFLLAVTPIFWIYYNIQKDYRPASRELNRLTSITRSPMFAHLGETLGGLETIRAYRAQDAFVAQCHFRMEENIRTAMLQIALYRWILLRLQCLGAAVVGCASLLSVFSRDSVPAGIAGLSLTYAMSMTDALQGVVHQIVWTETELNSAERLLHYASLPSEPVPMGQPLPALVSAEQLGDAWPERGAIAFERVSMRYRPQLEPVLRGVSISIRAGEKIGIVGRTGAGKSSLLAALFRTVELSEGAISIDGVDISRVPLPLLRPRLSVITQDSVLFSGPLRDNLDPDGRHDDDALWRVLAKVEMQQTVRNLPNQLQALVTDFGANFSLGQRQLLCLARALLRKSRVLVLDECTSAVDFATDRLIQQTIRSECAHATVLTIAHRINTIIDSDRVLVLAAGRVVEFDSPRALIANADGVFAALVRESAHQ